jgi:hypothetical protein
MLNLLAVLGQGRFGEIFLSLMDSNYYAVKMLKKKKILEKGMIDSLKLEF